MKGTGNPHTASVRFGARGRYDEARSAQWPRTPFDPLTLWMSPVDTLNLALRWGAPVLVAHKRVAPSPGANPRPPVRTTNEQDPTSVWHPDTLLVLRTQNSPEAFHSTPCVADLQGREGPVQGKRALARSSILIDTLRPRPTKHAFFFVRPTALICHSQGARAFRPSARAFLRFLETMLLRRLRWRVTLASRTSS